MRREFHPGTFTAGAIFVALGLAFTLEGFDVWTLRLSDLDVLFPIAMMMIGIAVLVAALWARPRKD